jgi:hypothetical protein
MATEMYLDKSTINMAYQAKTKHKPTEWYYQHLKPYQQEQDRVEDIIDQFPKLTNVIVRGGTHRLAHAFVARDDTGNHHRQRAGHVQPVGDEVSAHNNSKRY